MVNRRVCAVALVVTAVIHLAVVPEHAHEWLAAAVFFVGLAVAEVALACAVLARANRNVLLIGSVISLASAALWVASRTVGLPLGPEVFSPEAVAAPDLFATALEIFVAAAFIRLAAPTPSVGVSAHAYQ